MVNLSYGHDGPSPHEATINYTLSDCGDHYTITPRCYFDTKGSRAKVKLDAETGRMSIKPSKPVSTKDMKPGVTKFIGGGYLFLPKKCDVSKAPIIRHEGQRRPPCRRAAAPSGRTSLR